MTLLLLSLLALPLCYLIFLLPKLKKQGSIKHPPGPPGLPIIGHLHLLDQPNLPSQLWELSKIYGPIMSIKLGFRSAIVVSSPQMAREIMKTHDQNFCSRPDLFGIQQISYKGSDVVLSPYTEKWKELRKIMTLHLLSAKRVSSFRHVREDEVAQMINTISQHAHVSKPYNFSKELITLTNTIISRVAFGKIFDEEHKQRFQVLIEEAQAVMAAFYFSDHFPLTGWLDKLIGKCARLEKHFKQMDFFYQNLVDEHLDPNRPSSTQEDVIDILLHLKRNHSSSVDLTFDTIKALLMDIFLGGTETIAGTSIWTMTFLIKHPIVMKKAQEEVRRLIGNKERLINEDELQNVQLPYLKAVIREAFRCQPIVPLLVPREAMETCVIDNYQIDAKTIVYVNVWAIGRDPDIWKNPDEFIPERFLEKQIDFRGQDFELIPFGMGRRGCPGITMGLTTLELILSNLLNFFDWELPHGVKKEDIDTETLSGIAMHKKNALSLVPKIHYNA